jgi:hypothetical protein
MRYVDRRLHRLGIHVPDQWHGFEQSLQLSKRALGDRQEAREVAA